MAEKRRAKLVRQQQMAREAYEKALELLKKQEANLLHKTEVIQMEIGEEENVAAQMMNDVFAFNSEEAEAKVSHFFLSRNFFFRIFFRNLFGNFLCNLKKNPKN